jgi:cyanophycin synthetase
MRLRKTWALDGPNAWSNGPAIRLLLDMGTTQSDTESRLNQLMSGFGGVGGEEASDAEPDPGSVLASLIAEIQELAGDTVSFAVSSPARRPGQYDVVCGCYECDLALSAANVAVGILSHVVHQTEPQFDFQREFERRVMWHIRYRDSQREQQIVKRAAERRQIPVRMFSKQQRLVDIGLGAYTERFHGMMTSKSREIASRVARNKPLANEIMREQGVPVPMGAAVRSVADAIKVADRVGYPIVVKPSDRSQGTAVTIGIQTAEELTEAVQEAVAASKSGRALVERMVVGRDFRVVVIGDVVAGVLERVPASVCGDGERTVAALIARLNEDPRRQPDHPDNLFILEIDDGTRSALAFQGLTLESVPDAGQMVRVKLAANLHQGGTGVERTSEMHPDNALVARLAAKAVGLDFCGLDFISPDIGQSVWEVGGAIIEVNSEPGFRLISDPDEGQPRDIGGFVMDMFYPPGRPYQPVITTIAMNPGETSPAHHLKRILRATGMTIGLAAGSSTEFDGPEFTMQFATDRAEIQKVVRNPYVTSAILEIDQQEIEEAGLPFLHCDVAIVCARETSSPAAGARPVAEVLAGLVRKDGAVVCLADDATLSSVTTAAPGLILTSVDPDAPALMSHVQNGGRAIILMEDMVTDCSNGDARPIISLAEMGGVADVLPVMQAVAAALALNVSPDVIRNALLNGG